MKTVEAMKCVAGRIARGKEANSLFETALTLPFLLLLLIGAADFGKAYYVALGVASAAEAGALYGIQNPTDTSGMMAASRADAADIQQFSATAAYGCQCSDGSSATSSCSSVPTCSLNVVNYVQVDTSATYTTILNYPGIPAQMVLRGTARMRAAH